MVLDRLDDLGVELLELGGGAEGAGAHMAAGAAGDLGDLGGAQAARAAPVELGDAREGDVIDIHVEAHADRIGRHQIIDLAGLEHADLGVAGARAQGAEHHGGAAALAPHQLGEGEDVGGGEGDDGAAGGQPRHLARAGIGEGREARPRDVFRLGHQDAEQRTDRVGAEEHRLVAAARMQQAGGEDMAALGIGAELDLVDGEEIDHAVERHRFDGADEIERAGRDDLLFPGDQRHRPRALELDDAVVILARQEAQRKTDHPTLMAEHALDRKMRLAGIGRPQNRQDAGTGRQHAHGERIGVPGGKCKMEDAGAGKTPGVEIFFRLACKQQAKNRRAVVS